MKLSFSKVCASILITTVCACITIPDFTYMPARVISEGVPLEGDEDVNVVLFATSDIQCNSSRLEATSEIRTIRMTSSAVDIDGNNDPVIAEEMTLHIIMGERKFSKTTANSAFAQDTIMEEGVDCGPEVCINLTGVIYSTEVTSPTSCSSGY